MSYNLAPANAPWFEHLTDSVDALGEAAREWQLAAQAAELAHAQADPQRRTLHDATVAGRPAPDATGRVAAIADRTPHVDAVFELRRILSTQMLLLQEAYERAALLFASGAARAVRNVQDGEEPTLAVFGLDDDRALVPGSNGIDHDALTVARYTKARKVKAAHDRLLDCLNADAYGKELDAQEHVSEQDDEEIAECVAIAAGTADAAFTYGCLLQETLSFVLLGPRAAHRKQLAEQRAAQEPTETPGGDW